MGVALVITGMVHYSQIDLEAPLAVAFAVHGLDWAEVIISVGAFAGLTTTILTLLAAIPRVLMSMGADGLLPMWFGKINERSQTPVNATVVSGFLAAGFALIVNLDILAEIVSLGTLMAFTIACACVLILRQDPKLNISDNRVESTSENEMDVLLFTRNVSALKTTKYLLIIYSAGFITTSFVVVNEVHWIAILLLGVVTLVSFLLLHYIPSRGWVPYPKPHSHITREPTFSCPLVPTIPLLGIGVNVYMAANLLPRTWYLYFGWVGIGMIIYFVYGYRYSKLTSDSERAGLISKNRSLY